MIPYFELTTIPLGPIRIQVWGLFVALGILVALVVGMMEVRRRGLKSGVFLDLAAWLVLTGIVGGRLVYAAYEPTAFARQPLAILRLWDGGMSIFGGFFGAGLAAAIFAWRRRLAIWPYLEAAAFALPLGCAIGRLGCFLIHDHPGVASSVWFAVAYPGGPRLDHGLLLACLNLAIFGLFLIWRALGRQVSWLAAYLLLYGTARFVLDFWRAWDLPQSDVRWSGLTPAQYGSLILVLGGLALIGREIRRRRAAPLN